MNIHAVIPHSDRLIPERHQHKFAYYVERITWGQHRNPCWSAIPTNRLIFIPRTPIGWVWKRLEAINRQVMLQHGTSIDIHAEARRPIETNSNRVDWLVMELNEAHEFAWSAQHWGQHRNPCWTIMLTQRCLCCSFSASRCSCCSWGLLTVPLHLQEPPGLENKKKKKKKKMMMMMMKRRRKRRWKKLIVALLKRNHQSPLQHIWNNDCSICSNSSKMEPKI